MLVDRLRRLLHLLEFILLFSMGSILRFKVIQCGRPTTQQAAVLRSKMSPAARCGAAPAERAKAKAKSRTAPVWSTSRAANPNDLTRRASSHEQPSTKAQSVGVVRTRSLQRSQPMSQPSICTGTSLTLSLHMSHHSCACEEACSGRRSLKPGPGPMACVS